MSVVPDRDARIARAKSEIVAFIAAGTIPETVATFVDLHGYIDANELGGLCDVSTWPAMRLDEDGNADPDDHAAWLDECGQIQDAIGAWIRKGGARPPAHGGVCFERPNVLSCFNCGGVVCRHRPC